MAQPNQLGQRERDILTAVIETYLESGEPVGSRTVARRNREGLSPASIRNVMSDLAEAGMLEQPHTSAGRVPTPQAYRYYVEHLTGQARIMPADQEMIEGQLQGLTDVGEFMERTSRVLSLISRGVGVAITGAGSGNALEHVYFSRLADHKVLAVVVPRSGVVRDRLLRMQHDLPQADLELAARYINENFRGWTLNKVRAELARRIEQERSEYDRLHRSLEQLYQQGALGSDDRARGVYVEGAVNLLNTEQDRERLRHLMETLNEKERVAELLSAYLDARQEAVRVVIGLEDALPEMRNFVLIGAPARVGEEVMGSLAVIGPTRMDYQHTISAVSYIARLFDRILNEVEESR